MTLSTYNFLLILLLQRTILCEIVIIHESEPEQFAGWRNSSEAGLSQYGWQRQEIKGSQKKVFRVCDVKISGARNYLFSPEIDFNNAKTIYIEIRASIQSCDSLPELQNTKCSESLSVHWSRSSSNWNKLGTIKGPTTKTAGKTSTFFLETQSIRRHSSIFLRISDNGSCSVLYNVKVYYKKCPEIRKKLVKFPATVAPKEPFVNVAGACVENADHFRDQIPQLSCEVSGNWMDNVDSTCQCIPGFTLASNKCIPCVQGTYKAEKGDDACKRCPKGSHTNVAYGSTGTTKCTCDLNHFRLDDDDWHAPCVREPSKPRKIECKIEHTSVEITWLPPIDLYDKVWYTLECINCDEYQKAKMKINSFKHIRGTQTRVKGLAPDTQYTFRLSARNAVSHKSTSFSSSDEFSFKTEKQASIQNLRVVQNHDNGKVTVSWSMPLKPVETYYVKVEGTSFGSSSLSSHPQYYSVNGSTTSFQPLALPEGDYSFYISVYGKDGPYSDPVHAHLLSPAQFGKSQSQRVTLTIGLLCFIFLMLLSILASALCCYKRRKGYDWTNAAHLMEAYPPTEGAKVPLGPSFIDARMYDPPERMLAEFTQEIASESIALDVSSNYFLEPNKMKALLTFGNGESQMVSVKILKEDCTAEMWRKFAIEASTMGQLNHPNVLMLHGVISKGHPNMLVLEYTERGPLDRMLQHYYRKFSTLQIVHMLRGVACGMHYLSDEGFVHKVLIGGNILVSKSMVCKIAGFDQRTSLEEELLQSPESEILETVAPWCAPEVLSGRHFSSSSDVWSFGCLVWQCLSQGEKPFDNLTSLEISKVLDSGERLLRPEMCPMTIFELLCHCWQREKARRPWFNQIRECLEVLIRNPRQLETNTIQRADCHSWIPTLEEFLAQNGLNKYKSCLEASGITCLEDLRYASKETFRQLGISSSRHRKLFVKKLQIVFQKLETFSNEGDYPPNIYSI